jgi:integrase
MKKPFSDKLIRELPAADPGKRYMVWDTKQSHLGCRVTSSGHKSFIVWKRPAGGAQPVSHLLGTFPAMSVAAAREAVRPILVILAEGRKPKEIATQKRQEEQRAQRDTFGVVAASFIERHVKPLRTARAIENMVKCDLLPRWADRPIASITKRDVIEMVEGIVDRGARGQARKTLAAARSLFAWAVDRDILEASPAEAIRAKKLVGTIAPRSRVLNDDEIRAVWNAAGTLGYPWDELTRALLLTGARLREIADASWREIDLAEATLTVPVARMKMKVPHSIPLTPAMLGLLTSVPRFTNGDFVFSAKFGRSPVTSFSKAKLQLDRAIAATGFTLPPFSFHDLRRTCRTRLSTLQVPPHVAEMCIGHQQAGIIAIYDLHRYDSEKRAAMEAWERMLLSIVEPGGGSSNVTELAAARRA